jgi:hypothetical protein
MLVTVTKENTLFGSELELTLIEGVKVGPIGTTKDSKRLVIRSDLEPSFNWCLNLVTLLGV